MEFRISFRDLTSKELLEDSGLFRDLGSKRPEDSYQALDKMLGFHSSLHSLKAQKYGSSQGSAT